MGGDEVLPYGFGKKRPESFLCSLPSEDTGRWPSADTAGALGRHQICHDSDLGHKIPLTLERCIGYNG